MNPKVLFTAEEVVAACETARVSGDATYSTVFTIAPGGRSSANGATHYFDLYARAGGKEGKLFLRFKNERFAGRIQPLTGGEYTRDPARTPTLGIRKYPDLADDEALGAPGVTAESAYFKAIECVDTFFQASVAKLLTEGVLYKKDANAAATGGTKIRNDAAIRLFQSMVSLSAKENPGQPLTNPITRLGLKFDDSGLPRKGTEYYDRAKRTPDPDAPGGFAYEELKLDGEPLSASNVHKILPGSKISGIADLSAVCASTMGISVPMAVKCLFVELAQPKKFSVADVFGDDLEN
jgi:hypothetical protein